MPKKTQEEKPNSRTLFRTHVALYAKGNYVKSNNVINDLKRISARTGFLTVKTNQEWDILFMEILSMCYYAMSALGEEEFFVTKKDETIMEIPSLSATLEKEFMRFMQFLHNNRSEVIEAYGIDYLTLVTKEMDNIELQALELQMLDVNLVQAMLVTIAKYRPTWDLGEPDKEIMTPARPVKKEA